MELVMSNDAWQNFLEASGNEGDSWTRTDAERLRAFLDDQSGTGRRLLKKLLVLEAAIAQVLLNMDAHTDEQIRAQNSQRGMRRGILTAIELIGTSVMFDFDPDTAFVSEEASEREQV